MQLKLMAPLIATAGLLGPGPMAVAKPAPPSTRPAARSTKPAAKLRPLPSPRAKAPAASRGSAPIPEQVRAPRNNVWALLVGVSKYQNPAIVSLRFPATDATAIRDALVDRQLGGIAPGNVRLLIDEQATAANILGAVDQFLKPNVKPGDQVVVFLAGHGIAKGVGVEAKSFFLSTDAKGMTTPVLEASAVNLKALSEKLSELPAGQFVVFVDACREDPTPGRGIKGNTLSDVFSRGLQIVPRSAGRPASAASFFACSIGQRAFEDPTLKHGVFTYWILDGIRTADVPRRPDGAVDMGVLASYVSGKVAGWAKSASARGDFEVEQTPEFVTSELNEPIVLMRVQRPLPTTSLSAAPPTLTVLAQPAGAQVTVNGERVGAAPVMKSLPRGGQYTLRVEAPGCAPVERPITTLDGYGLQVNVDLPPGSGATGSSSQGTTDLYSRAQEAEARQQWEVAEAGYAALVESDPRFALGYERLADLRLRRGKTGEAIGTLIAMAQQMPTSHAYSLLSRAYSLFAARELGGETESGGKGGKKKKGGILGSVLGFAGKKGSGKDEPAGYTVPTGSREASALARRAADEALKLEPGSGEAQLALGFALIATDDAGKNKDAAMAAFGKAVLMQPRDASSHFGLGYGIRTFAQRIKDEGARHTELQRAVASLKEALNLRPGYYEAHRELAFCYHLLDNLPAARREYELANAHRGAATDENEVAAVNLSLSGIHRQEAQTAQGDRKQGLLAASDGYMSDAKEISPDLAVAFRILNRAGVSTRLIDYLPSELRQFLDLPGRLERNIKSRIPNPLGR